MLNECKDVLTVAELCQILRIGRISAYMLLQTGQIKYRQLRRKYIIPKIEVERYLMMTA